MISLQLSDAMHVLSVVALHIAQVTSRVQSSVEHLTQVLLITDN